MGYDDTVRTLAGWSRGGGTLTGLEAEIRELWVRLKGLRARAARERARRRKTCPVDFDDLAYRFWSKVDVIDDENSCWEFRGSRRPLPDNYGTFRWVNPITGVNEIPGANRVALFLATGVMPDHARHTCDNPPCCRPKHLVDGTHAQNMADRKARGRGRGKVDQRGESNDSSVLTDAIVVEARRRVRAGEGHEAIANDLGVPRPALSYAISGKTWSHLDEIEAPCATRRGGSRLTKDDVRTIRAARAAGVPCKTLAEQYGLTASAISHIARGKSWSHVTS